MPPKFNLTFQERTISSFRNLSSDLVANRQDSLNSSQLISPTTQPTQVEIEIEIPERKPTFKSHFNASQITPNIYLGNYEDTLCTESLLEKRITRILNISEECHFSPYLLANKDKFKIMQIPIKDNADEPIKNYFQDCINFIHDTVIAGENILVHCQMGISRSATIVLAYIMRYGFEGSLVENPISCYDAFDYIKQKRDINPNFGFMLALYEWDAV
jgi:hypothetical protein